MDRKNISERLRALATDDSKRSKAARLRDVIDDVEAALAAGVPRSVVVEELAFNGLEMTLATFETMLKRIRKKRGKPKAPGPATPPAPELLGTTETTSSETKPAASHNPGDLDSIIGDKPDLDQLAKHAKRMVKK